VAAEHRGRLTRPRLLQRRRRGSERPGRLTRPRLLRPCAPRGRGALLPRQADVADDPAADRRATAAATATAAGTQPGRGNGAPCLLQQHGPGSGIAPQRQQPQRRGAHSRCICTLTTAHGAAAAAPPACSVIAWGGGPRAAPHRWQPAGRRRASQGCASRPNPSSWLRSLVARPPVHRSAPCRAAGRFRSFRTPAPPERAAQTPLPFPPRSSPPLAPRRPASEPLAGARLSAPFDPSGSPR
jgi:hypothetical protein